MNRYLVDTNVFVYARGRDHPYRAPCRAVLEAVRDGLVVLEASVELVQEFAHLLLRHGADRRQALDEVEEVRSQCRLHAFDLSVLHETTGLLRRYPELGVRDAVHAATAVQGGLPAIVSADRVFDAVVEVQRVDPTDRETPWRGGAPS